MTDPVDDNLCETCLTSAACSSSCLQPVSSVLIFSEPSSQLLYPRINSSSFLPKLMQCVVLQVHLLRKMLEWQNDLLQEPLKAAPSSSASEDAVPDSSQVQILVVPTFKIEQVQRGTTAGDIIRSKVGRPSISPDASDFRQFAQACMHINAQDFILCHCLIIKQGPYASPELFTSGGNQEGYSALPSTGWGYVGCHGTAGED